MSQGGLLSGFSPGPALDHLRQPLRQLFDAPRARRASQGRVYEGKGQPVIVFPRQGTGPESTAPLRHALEQAGFKAHDWGHGVDQGPRAMGLSRWLRRLEECVIDAFEVSQQPVTLLGWGLSGIYARELAKRANPLVRQVITLGTPFNTAADPQRRCAVFALLDSGPERMPLAVRHRLRQRPPVPCTSVYSKDDGVVNWEQCVQKETPETQNIELAGVRHEDLAAHPRTLELVSHRLAQSEGQWKPFPRAARRLA
ncbi:alpha/beta hydrolase [Ramlibacter humi]|uniref:Alpha/beta hydrolase n=1 Tax=Ramlibacter humi TaxID=2530451 RepID=A0A4Z0CCW7_9BURK|nr:alpha/beta hydrolase [Ramlibacter humi]TFZ08105.1 alpha/beta hydrolase [Ramlibacter humi]